MKQIVQTARNLSLANVGDSKLLSAQIEVVLSLVEPSYGVGISGLSRVERIEDVRFIGSPDSLRKLAKHLEDFADDAEKECQEMLDEHFAACSAAPTQ